MRALHLGDLLLAVPAWRALRAGLPEAEITLIGLPWAAEFVRRYSSYLDRLVEFPGYPGMNEVEADETRIQAFLREARAYHYDLAIQMHGNGSTSNAFTAALGARYTVGYRPDDDPSPGLTHSLKYPDDINEGLRHLRLVKTIGAPLQGSRLEFPLQAEDYEELAGVEEVSLLSQVKRGDKIIGIHPGARPPARHWPPERFAAVADGLARRHNARIVVLAGPGEEWIEDEVCRRMNAPAINIAAKLSIGGMAALMSKLELVIANDSGPAHVAEAVGTKTVVLFGPADPIRWAPLDQRCNRIIYKNVECSPCAYWECPTDHRCLRRILPTDVLAVADDLLSAPNDENPHPAAADGFMYLPPTAA